MRKTIEQLGVLQIGLNHWAAKDFRKTLLVSYSSSPSVGI